MAGKSKLGGLETVGRWVQDIRHAKRQTQEAFAEVLGVSRQTVAKWETGKAEPAFEHSDRLRKLAVEAGVPPFHGQASRPDEARGEDALEAKLLRIFRMLSREQQLEVMLSASERALARTPPTPRTGS